MDLDQAVYDLENHLARADNKASFLLGFCGVLTALTIQAAVETPPPVAVTTVGAAALAALGTAVGFLLAVILPHNGGGHDCASWPYWSQRSVNEIAQQFREGQDRRPAQIYTSSRIAATKYRRIRVAGHFIAAGMVLNAAAALLAIAF